MSVTVTVDIPQAPPINAVTEIPINGTLYSLQQAGGAVDQILGLTDGELPTVYISLLTGQIYPTLPGNAVVLSPRSAITLTQS